jgi:hypothetical protein
VDLSGALPIAAPRKRSAGAVRIDEDAATEGEERGRHSAEAPGSAAGYLGGTLWQTWTITVSPATIVAVAQHGRGNRRCCKPWTAITDEG